MLRHLGYPERKFPSVLIGGTKGKGSTAAILSSILKEAGYRVGMFTSPHLVDVKERIKLNGRDISGRDWHTVLAELEKCLEGNPLPGRFGRLTYFEALTLTAVLFFAEKNVDIGVFEVGLGGRLDATNVLDPLVSVLTPVSLDHKELLGDTLTKIADEKSRIMRKGKRVIIGPQAPEVLRIFRRRAREIRAIGFAAGCDFNCDAVRLNSRALSFDWSSGSSRLRNLSLPLLGFFQADNASTALAAAKILSRKFSFRISEAAARRGLRKVWWPGRIHILKKRPLIVADGAHNGASMRALVETIQHLFPRRETIVIIGTSRGKELSDILSEAVGLRPVKVIATASRHDRALPVRELFLAAKRYFDNVEARPSLEAALASAHKTGRDRLILITGSLFLVGEALRLLEGGRAPKGRP